MIIATHGIVASQIVLVPVATAATSVTDTSFVANWNAYTGAVYYLLDVSTSSSFSSYVLQDLPVYTNSYTVTGLSSNTTYYYRVRASTEYDTDAQAFFTRVTTAGGSLTTTEQQATNTLVLNLKGYSIWSKMKAIYPMVGASAAACAQNLVSSSFTGTFSGGVTYASSGVTGNATNGYMNTNLSASAQLSTSSVHISIYANTAGNQEPFMGHGNLDLFVQKQTTILYGSLATTNYSQVSNSTGAAFYMVNRPNGTNQKLIVNNSIVKDDIKGINSYTPAYNITLLAYSPIQLFNNFTCSLASIGDGLSDTEASNFYTAVQAFQTTLSRQV